MNQVDMLVSDIVTETTIEKELKDKLLFNKIDSSSDVYNLDISVNTNEFKRAGQHFVKHGVYTHAPKNSSPWRNFWKEETRRCKEGYTVGNLWISGKHYFYLNYCPIKRLPDPWYLSLRPQTPRNRKVLTFPMFWEIDLAWWQTKEICKLRGMTGTPGTHLAVLKTRRAGFSYKEAAEGAYNFTFIPGSNSLYFAFNLKYLTGADGIFSKVSALLDFLNVNTYWKQSRIKGDRKDEKIAQWIDKQNNIRGTRSKLIAQPLDNSEKARGVDGEKIVFEEAGSFPGLLNAWTVAMPSVTQGDKTTGFMTAFGTGNNSDDDRYMNGLETLFYEPHNHNCIAFDNIWDEELEGTQCGFFCPANYIREDHMDSNGRLDLKASKQQILEEREPFRNTSNYIKRCIEAPLKPQEALNREINEVFPVEIKRIAKMRANMLENDPTLTAHFNRGMFGYDEVEGKSFWMPQQVKPFVEYPVKKGTTTKKGEWCVELYQSPYKDVNGNTPKHMYYIVFDPYSQDLAVSSRSIGACYIYKRGLGIDSRPDNLIVGSIVGRPSRKTILFDQVLRAAVYYNALIQFESRGGGESFLQYARIKRLQKYLDHSVSITATKLGGKPSLEYGLKFSADAYKEAMSNLAEWLCTPYKLSKGETIYNIERVNDIGLLREVQKHIALEKEGKDAKLNYDRLDAAKLIPIMNARYEEKATREATNKSKLFSKQFTSKK